MSNFWKILFGSCLGTLLALGVLMFIGFSTLTGLAGSIESTPTVSPNSVLTLDLETLPELTGNQAMSSPFALDPSEEVVGLHDLIRAIEHAAEDDNIKGIYIKGGMSTIPFTKLRTLRQAILEFKKSDKFTIAYAPFYEQSSYYLASAADEVYLGPLGVVNFLGMGAEIPFYKNLLDKVGVNMEVFWAGDYKSATEPFRRTSMSPQSREQTKEFLEDLFEIMLNDISAERGMSPQRLRSYADDMSGWNENMVVKNNLVDGIRRQSEVKSRIYELTGFERDRKIPTINASTYFTATLNKLKGGGSDEVAVLIAEGSIVDGSGDLGNIGDNKYVKEVEKLRKDEDVKAVVLRVNSGGGSASSSENIWYAIEELKETGKPVVVSMGDYAASGGYYIAAGADSIFAEPSTITGSIGVFMIFPNASELMNDKLGINFDTVNTARHATAFSPYRDLGLEEQTVLKKRTVSIYQTFLERVATGRSMDIDRVKEIAGGRVYSGMRAKELGLVDRLGGLDEAIDAAVKLANLTDEDYTIGHYPRVKPVIEQLIEELMGNKDDNGILTTKVLENQLGTRNYEHIMWLKEVTQAREPQASLPLVIRF